MLKIDVETALKAVEENLFSHPLIKAYFHYQAELKKNQDVVKLEQAMISAKYELSEATSPSKREEALKKLNFAEEAYHAHPLVTNFNYLQEEVNNLLHQIKIQLTFTDEETLKK